MDSELILYYVNLLIIQYRTLPKASAHIAALIKQLMIYDLMIQVRDGYDLDTAVGVQLDILGKYLGNDRIITGVSFTRDYFGMVIYGATAPFDHEPFIEYGDTIPDVQYRRYQEDAESLFTLNDEEYRFFLKLKLIQNYSNASNQQIDLFLEQFFGDNVIFTDRFNMTISYIFGENVERLVTIAVSEGLLPKPAAVGLSVTFVPDIENIYTYDLYGGTTPDFGVGFSKYGVTAVGSWLEYE